MVMGDYQAEQFGNVKLFAELVRRRDGKWFLPSNTHLSRRVSRMTFLVLTSASRISPRIPMGSFTLARTQRMSG